MENCSNEENKCGGRREFLVKASTIAGGVVLSLSGLSAAHGQKEDPKPAGAGADDELVLKLDPAGALSKVGGSQIFETKSGKIIVLHGENGFTAFSAKCTHKGGILALDEKTKQLVCPLHGSRFDSANGAVVKGPASQALAGYAADSAVVVSLKPKA